MLRGLGQSHRTLVKAVEVAIANGDLPAKARLYGKTDLLAELSVAMGLSVNALKNLYYRDEARLQIVLQAYIAREPEQASRDLRALKFREYSPVVWKRPVAELVASRKALPSTLVLLQSAERTVRESTEAPTELRREVGTVAAEIMACALTFYDGRQRLDLLTEGERIFKSAMSPLMLELEVAPEDAALFARFWENRATICGLLWSEIWDDPSMPPTVDDDVVALATRELDRAVQWEQRHGTANPNAGDARLRQLNADKAKWLAKAGRFTEAWAMLDVVGEDGSLDARADRLLLKALEAIANGRLREASSRARALAELSEERASENALAPVTAAILSHHIELLRDRRPALPAEVGDFLEHNPVVASEMVNLPRYRQRLAGLGYATPALN